jgi:ankyrin repeat protein/serine/threonine protein kinase
VNAAGNEGTTALMEASGKYGDIDRVRALIEAGANVNAKNNGGWTALMFASWKDGDVDRVRALIEAGAQVNAADNDGWTALLFASKNGDGERVRALIEAGADVNAKDNNGRTALMYTSGNIDCGLIFGPSDVDTVRALIEAGADVNAVDKDEKTALMCASGAGCGISDFCFGGDVERLRALIEAGADVKTVDNSGRTALMFACREGGDIDRVRALIEAGADVNASDNRGRTTLMVASGKGGDVDRVRALIEAGAQVNATANDGWTALMFASGDSGDVTRVCALIETGADVNARDTGGRSALSIAMEQGHAEVVAYLELQESQSRLASVGISDRGDRGGTAGSPTSLQNDPPSAPDIDSTAHTSTRYQAYNEHAEIDNNHITLGRELGQGSYATVYEATWHGVTIALKRIRPPHGTSWSSATQDLFRQVFEDQVRPEVNIMSAIRHPFVVGCYGCCVDPPSILLELCPRGSLGQMFAACREDASLRRLMTWRQRLCMLRQVASAMRYLHSKNVFHRDLRAMNVLVAQDMTTKVSDVGLSKFVDQVSSRSAGTLGDGANPRWLAPELVSEDGPFTRACDVYGFGTIVWEMMEWRLPWENMSSVQIVRAILQQRGLEVASQESWSSLPGPAPHHTGTLPGISSLARRCLSTDPRARPSFEDIVQILLELEEREPQGELGSNVASGSHSAPNSGRRADALNRLAVCCVCLDADADTIMSGCGHLCLCRQCSEAGQFSSCPACRSPGLPQRIYFA